MNPVLARTLEEQGFREFRNEWYQLFYTEERSFDREPRDAIVSVTADSDEIHIMTTSDCKWDTVFTGEQRLILELAGYSVKYARCSTTTLEATEQAAKRKYRGRGV